MKGGRKAIIAITLIAIVLIICISFLIGLYMDHRKESRTKMFTPQKYDERIRDLERRVEKLEENS